MKNFKFIDVCAFVAVAIVVSGIIQIIGVETALASANQITRKMNNIKSNLLLVTQAGAGIGMIIGLIVWNLGSSEIGRGIVKSGAIALVFTFMYPGLESFFKTISGS